MKYTINTETTMRDVRAKFTVLSSVEHGEIADMAISKADAVRLCDELNAAAALRTDLETAVMHLRAILEQHGDASESLVQAERWLMSREVMIFECKHCKKAPKNGQWKRNYKWKTERGYKNHSCYADELKRIEEREKEKQRKRDLFDEWLTLGVSDHKVGDTVFYVGYTVTHPTHEYRGSRRVRVRYEEKRSYWNSEGTITRIEPPSFFKESDLIDAINDKAKFPCFYYIGNIRPLEICETKERAYEISRELDAAYKKHCKESSSFR